ncbi:hypothetical protein T439DRAFT_358349 [Meredithblackwellia eburnea MCA 4105]
MPRSTRSRSRAGSLSSRRSFRPDSEDDAPRPTQQMHNDDFVTPCSHLDEPEPSTIPRRSISRKSSLSRLYPELVPPKNPAQQPLEHARFAASASARSGQGSHYDLLQDFKIEYSEKTIKMWVSRDSGFTVVFSPVEQSIIEANFQVNTEIFDDTGRPHTLEHLSLSGSKHFPWKGALDEIAKRMIGYRADARTAKTNTTYTMSTASQEGFLKLLPVYLDHLFFPTLTDSAFTTEVFHIDGKGQDGGVVLRERQSVQSTCSDRVHLKTMRTVYNKNNGNRSEPGGRVSALRELHLEDIRSYHDTMYVPQNMTLMVFGSAIDPLDIIHVLDTQLEPALAAAGLANGPNGPPGWKRPFVQSRTAENPPFIEKNTIETVLFPSEDESEGIVMVNWVTCFWQDQLNVNAIDALFTYLADSDSEDSPLQQVFVQGSNPWCSDIDYDYDGNPRVMSWTFNSVKATKLDDLPAKLNETLRNILRDGIDLERMKTTLEHQLCTLLDQIESDTNYLKLNLSDYALYGARDGSDLQSVFQDLRRAKSLFKWTQTEWNHLLAEYFVTNPYVAVIGRPSAALAKKKAEKANSYVASNVSHFGPAGLKQLDQQLAAAVKANASPIPKRVLRQFEMPALSDVHCFEPIVGKSLGVAKKHGFVMNDVQRLLDAEGIELPLHVSFAQVKGNFVTINIALTPSKSLSNGIRALIPVYTDMFTWLPLKRASGETLTSQQALNQVMADSVSCSMNVEDEQLVIRMKVLKDKYAIALEWLKDMIWGSVFDPKCLKVSVNNIIQTLQDRKQDGTCVASNSLTFAAFNYSSNSLARTLFVETVTMPALLQRLQSNPSSVVKDLETLRQDVANPRMMRVQVIGDILSMKSPAGTWIDHFEPITPFSPRDLIAVPKYAVNFSPLGLKPKESVKVIQVGSLQSSVVDFRSMGPATWDHPESPALALAVVLLNSSDSDGPLWNAVQGNGFPTVIHSALSGALHLVLDCCPDAHLAWTASRNVVEAIVDGRRVYANQIILDEDTPLKAASNFFTMSDLQGCPANMAKRKLDLAKDVTASDVVKAISHYVVPLFHPATSTGVIACGPSQWDETSVKFSQEGYKVEKDVLV